PTSHVPDPIPHEFSHRSSQCGYGRYLKEPQTGEARCDGDHEEQIRYGEEWDHVAYDAHQKDNEDRVAPNENHDCAYEVAGQSWLRHSTPQQSLRTAC